MKCAGDPRCVAKAGAAWRGLLLAALCLLTSTAGFAAVPAPAGGVTIGARDSHVAVMGRTRVNADGGRSAGYPGVSYFLRVDGRTLEMRADSDTGQGLVDVIVDGVRQHTLRLAQRPQTYVLFRFAAPGVHEVRVVTRTETWQAVSTIHDFMVRGGEFLAAPALPKRKLLLLGDSVTCGEMIDRVPGEKPQPSWNDPLASYGMLAAAALHAQVQLVCYGGRGLIRSWTGSTTDQNLPDFYALSVAEPEHPASWDKHRFTPDLVISAIGTNDFTVGVPDRATYVAAYAALVRRILADYPHAQIGLTEGAILSGANKRALAGYIADTVAVVRDPRVHQLLSTHYPGDAQDAHPTKAQHREMAADLVPQVRALMHW